MADAIKGLNIKLKCTVAIGSIITIVVKVIGLVGK